MHMHMHYPHIFCNTLSRYVHFYAPLGQPPVNAPGLQDALNYRPPAL